ncbi:MAG: AAA family ATPase [Bacteroidota bacterium]
MKIIIFGASGVGTTTLGKSLAEKLNWTFLDADDYYWEKTNPPFQQKIELKRRNEQLKKHFLNHENVIISGSLVTWGAFWNSAFDLGAFLSLPKAIRMDRLRKREQERYGKTLETDQAIKEKSKAFLAWAGKYDDEKFNGRTITQHRKWISMLNCEVLEIHGDLTNGERQDRIIECLEDFRQKLT